MKLIEIANCVAVIREVAWDDEKAHGLEDDLHHDALCAIAENTLENVDAAVAAKIALDTLLIDFARWCA